jgi:NAD(P)-dependent dehydrogenase (short-subunit alcohol dehydrogenase family)
MARGGGGAVVNITSISGQRASTLRAVDLLGHRGVDGPRRHGVHPDAEMRELDRLLLRQAALKHLTKQQAVELAHLGIRVNAVAPGPVDTAIVRCLSAALLVP